MELTLSKREKPRSVPRAAAAAVAAPRDVVALVGFMGAGKTSVGNALAERLGVPFIDLDRAIVEAAGAPIAQLFREFGEVAAQARIHGALQCVCPLKMKLRTARRLEPGIERVAVEDVREAESARIGGSQQPGQQRRLDCAENAFFGLSGELVERSDIEFAAQHGSLGEQLAAWGGKNFEVLPNDLLQAGRQR